MNLGSLAATLACASLVACSSSTLPAQGLPPGDVDASVDAASDTAQIPTGNGLPDCNGACCTNHTAGTPCAASDEGASCPTSTLCPGGLVLPQSTVCESGTWTTKGGECAADGGVAGNGCPDSQPTNGTPCALPNDTWCQYALECKSTCDAGPPPPPSDGGGTTTGTGCASTSGKVGPAFCRKGTWETTPLGTCP